MTTQHHPGPRRPSDNRTGRRRSRRVAVGVHRRATDLRLHEPSGAQPDGLRSAELYPRVHRRYTSLAIIGPILDGYGTWLLKRGYSAERVREHFRAAPRLVRRLQQGGVRALTSLTRVRLGACRPADSREDPNLAVLVRQLARYCESELSLYPSARADPHRGASRRLRDLSAAGPGVRAVDRHQTIAAPRASC